MACNFLFPSTPLLSSLPSPPLPSPPLPSPPLPSPPLPSPPPPPLPSPPLPSPPLPSPPLPSPPLSQVPSLSDVSISFKKLMRGCSPSPLHTTSHMAAAEESGWISQLSTIMQLAGAVADLIDVQGSSVLVCLENGWDATAQVSNKV